MSDETLTLIQGCLARDAASWQALIDEYSSVAWQLLGSRFPSLPPADHEDIIQNVAMKLLTTGLKNFNGTTKYELLGYFRTMTSREALSALRRSGGPRSTVSLDQPVDDSTDSTLVDLLPDEGLTPETIAELNDLYRNAVGQLSVKERRILLYKIDGYKDREIAELLGISLGSVAGSYNRIRELLRTSLLIVLLLLLSGRKLPWMAS